MKRILFGVLWLAAFIAVGAAVGRHVLPHPVMAAGLAAPGAALGGLTGALGFFFLAGLNLLPGARLRRGERIEWGWKQAVWMVVQFFTMQAAAQTLLSLVFFLLLMVAPRLHIAPPKDASGILIVVATAAGYVAAGWWSVWYIGRLGWARLTDGSAAGIGWRAAPWQAYAMAVGCLLVAGVAGAAVQHVFPPGKNSSNLFEQIFGPQLWKEAVLFVIAAVAAPFLEELVFRGGMIAALSPRLGAFWGAAVTSLVFTGCHAEEFLTYHPGLLVILVIAVLLAWLRLKYRSIRPGIFLHVLFNGAGVVMMALSR
jgi:membrane protease YdiL (CAAX protease family)